MALTNTQLQTLKTDIQANFAGVPNTPDGNQQIAEAYNQQATPDFWVFKTSVDVDTAREALDWAEILSGSPLAVQDRWAFDVLTANGDFNPALVNTRNGFAEIFNGQPNTRNALLDLSVRLASRAEKLFSEVATGPAGGDGSAKNSSAVMTFEGNLTRNDVEQARNA